MLLVSERSLWYDGTRHVRPIRNFRNQIGTSLSNLIRIGRPYLNSIRKWRADSKISNPDVLFEYHIFAIFLICDLVRVNSLMKRLVWLHMTNANHFVSLSLTTEKIIIVTVCLSEWSSVAHNTHGRQKQYHVMNYSVIEI